MTQKIYPIDKTFCHHQKFFLLKNTFKVALQYLFNVIILLNIVFNRKLNFKQKIDPKMRTFKKPGRYLENLKLKKKTSGNSDY